MARGPIQRVFGDGPTYDATSGNVLWDIDKRNVKAASAEVRAYRREASRLASMANKRIERLERNGLTDTPAYKNYIAERGRFSVKGKTYNELQQEVSRLKRFIDTQTSTVKGTMNVLKEMARNTGMTYKSTDELKVKSAKFFELASKVEQYLRTVEDMASAVGYQKIWEAINQYTKDAEIDLSQGGADIDSMVEAVSRALAGFDNKIPIVQGWYTLKKSDVSSGDR